ncbi:MAG TPA: DNA/RNA nuclease SfsA [Methanomicrobia archaeon]|nr:DNA/RNA nuclease SfsA [Methanomicrobia archaeon]
MMSMSRSVMPLPYDAVGTVVGRDNRFRASVDIIEPIRENGASVHVHDPGRIREVIYPGNTVLLRWARSQTRTTDWDMLAGDVGGEWVLVHSGYHSTIAEGILRAGLAGPSIRGCTLHREVTRGGSRFDFLLECATDRHWIEVKGCSLSRDGVALFPDAPTTRGTRHLEGLIDAVEGGDRASVVFLVLGHAATSFSPNSDTDPHFAEAFARAVDSGVTIYPLRCTYDGCDVSYHGVLPVR